MNNLFVHTILAIFCIYLASCTSNKTIAQEKTTPVTMEVTEVKEEKSISDPLHFLKGLRKANIEDFRNTEWELDGESIPIYLPDGKRIKGNEMLEALISIEFSPEIYINEDDEVVAYVVRKHTEKDVKMANPLSTMDEELNRMAKTDMPLSKASDIQEEGEMPNQLQMLKKMVNEKSEDSNMSAEEMKHLQDMIKMLEAANELVGTDATPFTVIDMTGAEYSLESLQGKVVVLNFWFIACKPCVMEIPELNELVEKYHSEDIVFIGFANDRKKAIEKFLVTQVFDYNLIPNSMMTAQSYQVFAFPTHVVINKDSKIELILTGFSETTIGEIDETIGRLLDK